jgi:hypothetical protein
VEKLEFVCRSIHEKRTVIWLYLPLWQLRKALEEPQNSRKLTECLLWVASEWIVQCAGPIFNEMSSNTDLDESDARVFRTGPLCDAELLSVERWQFWKKRFSDLVIAGVDTGVAGHVSAALRSIEAAEG